MTFRARFLLATCPWIVFVAAGLVLGPLLVRDQLPNPVATHWGMSGRPDAAQPLGVVLVTFVVLWLVLVALAFGAWGRIRRRSGRAWVTVVLLVGGVFMLGMATLTLWANAGVGTWSAARAVSWHVVLVLACCVPAGWLGWYLSRFGPDERPCSTSPVLQRREVKPSEDVMWVSVTLNRMLQGIGAAAGIALLIALVGGTSGWFAVSTGGIGIGLGVTSITMLVLGSVRVQADRGGVRIAVGPLRWPRGRIALDRIEAASCEQRYLRNVGGWGYRGFPGSATVMIRGGECLVLHYHGGGEFAVSVDDAERGAALINGLLAERAARR